MLDIDDDTSDIYMNQANKYRENILPSEKAWGYRVEYDARKRLGTLPQDLDIYDQMADSGSDSVSTIKRLIRLTYLEPKLLDMVDSGEKIKISHGVLLSKLSKEEQSIVLSCLEEGSKPLSLKHAEKLRDMHDGRKKITKDVVNGLIGNTFAPRTNAPKEKLDIKEVVSLLPGEIKILPKERQLKYISEALKRYEAFFAENENERAKYR